MTARATIPIATAQGAGGKSAAFEYLTTKKDELCGWARKFSLFPVSVRDRLLCDGVHGGQFVAV